MMSELWFVLVAFGPLVIAAAVIYFLMRRRRLTHSEERLRDEKTHEVYSEK